MNTNQLLQTLIDAKGYESVNIDELNDSLDQLLEEYNAPKVPSSEVERIIRDANRDLMVGTWFLLKIGNSLFISKEKPEKTNTAWTIRKLDPTGWLQLNDDGSRFMKPPYSALTREDFNCLKLPEVTEEDSPLEIEIMPSGNVYFY